ncbi:thermonuclease family protein [Polaromonas sp.]|nr:thermonuclease family protein [Candidatus Saccharibacteria bacterium]
MRRHPPRHFKQRLLGISLICIPIIAVVFYVQANNHISTIIKENRPGYYAVSHFVDGDTIAVIMQGKEEKVRFIGVDTPETHKPHTPVQCYGPAAAAHTKNVIGTQRVRLEADRLSTNRDRYDRLLRYVYLADGTLLNKAIIQNGYGFYYPYFPYTKAEEFKAAQELAQAGHRGLWGNCNPIKKGEGYESNVAT